MFEFLLTLTTSLSSLSATNSVVQPNVIAVAQPNLDAAAEYQNALVLHQAEQWPEAVAAYQRVIDLDPSYDAAYINLSLIFIAVDDLDSAKPLLQQVLELPDREEFPASIHAIAHYNLGIIQFRQGALVEALAETEQALAIAPNFEQAQTFLAQLQAQNSAPTQTP
ncbi:MAG: tetratricopeptide repeat protein [Limnothrix sp. RL_2_0]|nr:tetratricopeptide repeat protein [Limnothrix sp. RL_2_0]